MRKPNGRSRPRRLLSLFLKSSLSLSVFVVTLFVLLKTYDAYVGPHRSSALPGLDIESRHTTIHTLELHPFTGWHVQSNFAHEGPLAGERNPDQEYDIRSGQLGFFIDFDLDKPPQKGATEYRIILIGGSGAQGWGASSNDTMLYRVLEKRLNQLLGETGLSFKVINMAMGGSITYQNYIALNRWGHKLQPDLVLTYSGRNDFWIPLLSEELPDSHRQFTKLNAFVYASRGSEYSARLRWASDLFPNVMNRTNVGLALKMLVDYPYYEARAYDGYKKSRGLSSGRPEGMSGKQKQDLVRQTSEFYIHALKSIKRDFEGVPIMVAWQAVAPHQLVRFESYGDDFYNQMFEKARFALEGYSNQEWYFVNVHRRFERDPRPYIGTHLSDEGHVLVGDFIARAIEAEVFESLSE